MSPQAHHPKGKCDGGHEDKPLRDHGHQRGDHPQQRIVEIIAGDKELRIDCQGADGNENPGNVGQDLVDAAEELGISQREFVGLSCELGGVSLLAHFGGLISRRPHHDRGTRVDHVPNALIDGIGFTGERGLIDSHVRGVAENTVNDDLVTGTNLDEIVEDDGLAVDLASRLPVANDHGFCTADNGKLVQCALGTQFLDDADDRVGDNQQTKGTVDD